MLVSFKMDSAQSMFVEADAFDAENVYYAKPRTNPSGGKNVGILDSSIKKQLAVSVPLMLTWGVNEWTDDSGKKSYDLSLQFPRESDDNFEKCKKFLKSLKEFEAKLLKDALVNSKEWFGKKYDLAPIVEALYTPMLRYSKDESGDFDYTRAPSLRVKIPYWDGKYNFELYDLGGRLIFPNVEDETLSPTTLITKGQKIATIIKCGGIWFAGGKFGVTWKLVQAVVQPRLTLRGKCHITLNTTERTALEESAKQVQDDDEEEAEVSTQVENSDDEEEAEEVKPVEHKEPVKPVETEEEAKPKKKRVVKKKSANGD
jgi:hypothetical protein